MQLVARPAHPPDVPEKLDPGADRVLCRRVGKIDGRRPCAVWPIAPSEIGNNK